MKKILSISALLILLSVLSLNSQNPIKEEGPLNCHFEQQMKAFYEEYPEAKTELAKDVQKMKDSGKMNLKSNAPCPSTVTLPVVFHYIYDESNLSGYDNDNYIINTILAGTNDWLAVNSSIEANLPPAFQGIVATDGSCIELCLAQYDHPQNANLYGNDLNQNGTKDANGDGIIDEGQYAINRYAVDASVIQDIADFTGGGMSNYVQGVAPGWSYTEYLNVYVVPNISFAGAYAYFPNSNSVTFNSIYMSYNSATGGITLAHEIGHWAGLNHVWENDFGGGCGNEDYYLSNASFPVNDTYSQDQPSNQGAGCNATVDSQVPTSCGTPDNVFNLMDYSFCDGHFTNEQAAYIHNTVTNLNTSGRSNFGNNIDLVKCQAPNGCTNPVACNYDVNATIDDGSCQLPDCLGNCNGELTGPTQPGSFCDNGDPCTSDVYDANCNCVANTFIDTDNDGVCNANDVCPGLDDALIGTACDDGLDCTINDVYDANTCTCIGTAQGDADNDGVCDDDDVCPNFDDNLIGTACNDNDPCTLADTYNTNCECTGIFLDNDNDGVCNANDVCPGFDDTLIGTTCEDGDPCTTGELYDNNCDCTGGTFADSDNDTVCDGNDSCPNLDNALIGMPCDDLDPCTTNDVYDGTTCSCIGTFIDTDNDGVCDANDVCAGFDDNLIATSCDDGDDCTVGDVYDGDCECVGDFADSDGDGVCDAEDVCGAFDDALIGMACDDNDACTINDVYDGACNCIGLFADADADGVCDANDVCPNFDDTLIGAVCNDNDPCTVNDIYDNFCNCLGVFADTDGDGVCDAEDICTGDEPGTVCDDGNANTDNDVIDASCNCIGVVNNSCTLEIPLNAGWNIISSYCMPTNPDMEIVFTDIVGNTVQVKNLTETYVPAFGFNNIGDWDMTSGYQVKMVAADTLIINGTLIDPLATPINLNSGWNLISYLLDTPSEPTNIYIDVNGNMIQLKNLTGTYIPSFNFNDMGNVLPTQGYQVKMDVNDVLIYDPANQ